MTKKCIVTGDRKIEEVITYVDFNWLTVPALPDTSASRYLEIALLAGLIALPAYFALSLLTPNTYALVLAGLLLLVFSSMETWWCLLVIIVTICAIIGGFGTIASSQPFFGFYINPLIAKTIAATTVMAGGVLLGYFFRADFIMPARNKKHKENFLRSRANKVENSYITIEYSTEAKARADKVAKALSWSNDELAGTMRCAPHGAEGPLARIRANAKIVAYYSSESFTILLPDIIVHGALVTNENITEARWVACEYADLGFQIEVIKEEYEITDDDDVPFEGAEIIRRVWEHETVKGERDRRYHENKCVTLVKLHRVLVLGEVTLLNLCFLRESKAAEFINIIGHGFGVAPDKASSVRNY